MTGIRHRAIGTGRGDFSLAVSALGRRLIFVSSLIAVDATGACPCPGEVDAQARFILSALGDLLTEAGASLGHLVLTRVYLVDIDDLSAFTNVRREFLSEPFPAATIVEVSRLEHPDLRIAIEAIAAV